MDTQLKGTDYAGDFAISKTQFREYLKDKQHIIHMANVTSVKRGKSWRKIIYVLCRKAGQYSSYQWSQHENYIICEDCLTLAGEH